MKRFIFFYEELVGGNKYREEIEAESFREARNIFFNNHPESHRIDSIINQTSGERLY